MMPPPPKRSRIVLLDSAPSPDDAEPTITRRRKSPEAPPPAGEPATPTAAPSNPPQRKRAKHKCVIFNNAVYERGGLVRFSLVGFCLRTHMTFTTSGRTTAELLDVSRLMQRIDKRCSCKHKFSIPFPLRTKRPYVIARECITR